MSVNQTAVRMAAIVLATGVAWAVALGVAACSASTSSASPLRLSAPLPRTRAERTSYAETSHYADVVAFLDSLQSAGVPMWRDTLGVTTEGRALPLVVLSRPQVHTVAEAKALGRPIVYVQANIHAGEVEGKEALLALIRDLATARASNVLDSVILVAVPIYNADGNEKFAAQSVNRTEQNGPEMVGTRANAQGLDLNRDYVKAEAPETRASLAAFNTWDPDVFVDLHTTDGSFHGYALTYSPSLNPAAFFGGVYARDILLPELRERMRTRHGFEIFDYGNFSREFDEDFTDTVKHGWFSYEHLPRYGTNYYGLRGRIAILSEAYSHDPFERRVKSTYAFVQEILSAVAERAPEIRELIARADSAPAEWVAGSANSRAIPIRAELTTHPREEPVIFEDLARTGDSAMTQPGVPKGLRRTGHFRTQVMPVYDRFEPTLEVRLPAGWIVRAEDTAALELLREHGVQMRTLDSARSAQVELFAIDSVTHEQRAFQAHHQARVYGRWERASREIPAGAVFVDAAQPLGILAAYLLEPESDDGLVTWNVFEGEIRSGEEFPVVRVGKGIAS